MLHHYNYSSPLSHFLSYHQLQNDQNDCSNGQTTPTSVCEDLGLAAAAAADSRFKSVNAANGKSFTIAAILGLKQDSDGSTSARDLTTAVVNLSVHQGMTERSSSGLMSDCSRLQLPLMRNHGSSGLSNAPYPTVSQHQQNRAGIVRALKSGASGSGSGSNTAGTNPNKKTSSSKSKRVRTIFTPEQLERLEAEFERQQYMVGPERLYLAHTLQLTEAQVKVWFQNRRIKWRKHHLEITHQRLAAIKQQQLQQQLLGETNTDTLDSNNSSSTDT